MGPKGWQRLHNTNYYHRLALLHVVLARGTYAEQYLLSGLFVWLMLWRVLDRYRLGFRVKALIALRAVFCCLFTAFLEAGFMWGRRGYDVIGTLRINFMFAPAEIGVQPPWQVLAFGLVFAFGAMARAALRVGGKPRGTSNRIAGIRCNPQ